MADLVLDTMTLRERLDGMSQAAFAAIAHVDQSSVSLWESDKNAPSRAAAACIQQYCVTRNVKLAWKPAPGRSKGTAEQARAS
ncbi:MAG TPA: hypothetical protein DEQ40_09070 [Oxalobacteraceae bacterium]|jgi:transcriptional regulator with XRE-family HTH domain|nr:hypothetical protein [Oxalobacteraceae bacterium]